MGRKLDLNTRCQNCNYEWESKSKLLKASCPSCGSKVTVGNLIEDDKK